MKQLTLYLAISTLLLAAFSCSEGDKFEDIPNPVQEADSLFVRAMIDSNQRVWSTRQEVNVTSSLDSLNGDIFGGFTFVSDGFPADEIYIGLYAQNSSKATFFNNLRERSLNFLGDSISMRSGDIYAIVNYIDPLRTPYSTFNPVYDTADYNSAFNNFKITGVAQKEILNKKYKEVSIAFDCILYNATVRLPAKDSLVITSGIGKISFEIE